MDQKILLMLLPPNCARNLEVCYYDDDTISQNLEFRYLTNMFNNFIFEYVYYFLRVQCDGVGGKNHSSHTCFINLRTPLILPLSFQRFKFVNTYNTFIVD